MKNRAVLVGVAALAVAAGYGIHYFIVTCEKGHYDWTKPPRICRGKPTCALCHVQRPGAYDLTADKYGDRNDVAALRRLDRAKDSWNQTANRLTKGRP